MRQQNEAFRTFIDGLKELQAKEDILPCHKCGGFGSIEKPEEICEHNPFIKVNETCSHCNGKGFIDWIENITGVKQ